MDFIGKDLNKHSIGAVNQDPAVLLIRYSEVIFVYSKTGCHIEIVQLPNDIQYFAVEIEYLSAVVISIGGVNFSHP